MRIDLHIHQRDDDTNPVLRRDEFNAAICKLLEAIMTAFGERLDRLEAVVAKEDTVEGSFLAYTAGLVDQVRTLKAELAAAGVPAAELARVEALASHIEERTDRMAAALVAGTETPAPAPEPAPEPTPEPAPVEDPAVVELREPPNEG